MMMPTTRSMARMINGFFRRFRKLVFSVMV